MAEGGVEQRDIAGEGNNWLVNETDVRMLMDKVARHRYYKSDNDSESVSIMNMCTMLFERDYECQHLDNQRGKFCPTYPMNIIIPVKERADVAEAQFPNTSFDVDEFIPLVEQSHLCRRKHRFPVPVILFEGKYICRSASIYSNVASQWSEEDGRHKSFETKFFEYGMTIDSAIYLLQNVKFRRQIIKDADVMRYCNIRYIFDLRMENSMQRRSPTVNASEGVYLQYYTEFKKISVPYPEVASFRDFCLNPEIEELYYDWTSEWKVLVLTENYLLLLLHYIALSEKGALVHCITGIDRTPLFITLLRLSLWADGLIHKSLNPIEMTYFTVAYDWYLFGHDLPKRANGGHWIMFFCFSCLAYISSLMFSIRASIGLSRPRDRLYKLNTVYELFEELYYSVIKQIWEEELAGT
ncbi:myotubularin-related protein 14-like isoform X2 [Stegodyphus dumicola]|uniref:myotubularin-related protein 14-like isoform X2 n=1 Tax=Stegodyphus dumicola TaxID=202533 RepID=UPI0015ABEB50|nr:myotubularin-related protein 14-like isoform X2 [Stegodyphus dumicola]